MVTKDYLNEKFYYKNGSLFYKQPSVSRGTRLDLVNKEAGHFDKSKGYHKIEILRRNYPRAKLIYIYFNGNFEGLIDHINGVRNDDRIENLRVATPLENARNKSVCSTNKTKIRNVYLQANGKYIVRLGIDRKSLNFGTYEDLELAELVAEEARDKYYGEFAGYEK
jgi:hypothetical protein